MFEHVLHYDKQAAQVAVELLKYVPGKQRVPKEKYESN